MKSCCLCSNLAPAAAKQLWDSPVLESQNFVVIPSLGSLVEGWLLLVPRDHFISLGALPDRLVAEMEDMKAKVSAYVGNEYGKVCAFEHGPASTSRKVGCSVDHAHLHIVPFGSDIATAARPFMPHDAMWNKASWRECREAYRTGKDYLYFEQPLGSGWISVHQNFGSQIFRKAIAAQIGRLDEFNWREHPQFDTVAKTIDALAHAAYTNEEVACEQ
jgi:ATP adenylyltransferase